MVKHLIFGTGSVFIVSFLSLIFIARNFPLQFISDVKAATIYGGWFSLVFTGQVHTAYLYFYDKLAPQPNSVKLFSLAYLLVAAIICSAAFSTIFPLLYAPAELNSVGLIAFGIVTGMNLLFVVSASIFTSNGSSKRIPIFMLCYSLSALISLLLANFLGWSVNHYAISLASLNFIVLSSSEWRKYFLFLYQNLTYISGTYNAHFCKYAGRMSFAIFFESIGERLDKILAARFLDQAMFAKYSVLCFENPLVNLLLNSYGITLVKNYNKGTAGKESEFKQTWATLVRRVSFVTFPISIFLIFNYEWFISNIFGSRFSDSGKVFQIYLCVTLIRFGPFQALLRLEGAVRSNVLISLTFFAAALLMSAIVLSFGLSLDLLATAYLAAWLVFNGTAIFLFIGMSRLTWLDILTPTVWISRVAQCLFAITVASTMAENSVPLQIGIFGICYLSITCYFDRDIGRMLLKLCTRPE